MEKNRLDLSAFDLKLLAMAAMLADHIGYLFFPQALWMRCVGRLAFPIFAFMAVEGYFHTRSFKRYALRMLLFAVLSEVPFDLMYGGTVFYPVHQNVIWTLLLGLLGIRLTEAVRRKGKRWAFLLVFVLVALAGMALGTLGMVDYYGSGVVTVLIFYLCRQIPYGWLGEVAGLAFLNCKLLGGMTIPLTLGSWTLEFPEQGLALLALIPIWLYNGRQGAHNKAIQYACYAFYPAHMLILALLRMYL